MNSCDAKLSVFESKMHWHEWFILLKNIIYASTPVFSLTFNLKKGTQRCRVIQKFLSYKYRKHFSEYLNKMSSSLCFDLIPGFSFQQTVISYSAGDIDIISKHKSFALMRLYMYKYTYIIRGLDSKVQYSRRSRRNAFLSYQKTFKMTFWFL